MSLSLYQSGSTGSHPAEPALLHERASLLLTTETGATLRISGLTDSDIAQAAALITEIVKRDSHVAVARRGAS